MIRWDGQIAKIPWMIQLIFTTVKKKNGQKKTLKKVMMMRLMITTTQIQNASYATTIGREKSFDLVKSVIP
jgi:hypothetical protein